MKYKVLCLASIALLLFVGFRVVKQVLRVHDMLSTKSTIGRGKVDNTIKPFLNKFIHEYENRGHSLDPSNISISIIPYSVELFGDTNVAGVCYFDHPFMGPEPTIVLQKEMWAKIGFSMKEVIIYHELGHCLLNRDHCEYVDPTRTGYASIMGPNAAHIVDNFVNNRKEMLDELFSPREECQ